MKTTHNKITPERKLLGKIHRSLTKALVDVARLQSELDKVVAPPDVTEIARQLAFEKNDQFIARGGRKKKRAP